MTGRRAVVVALVGACAMIAGCGSSFDLPGSTPASSAPASGATAGAGNFDAVSPDLVFVNTVLGEQQEQAAGTGIVLTSSGEVLTNNHVIEGATSIRATDAGTGQTYTAAVVGYDRSHDVALLQLQGAHDLATATLATSERPAVGAKVAAVGNAGGTGTLSTAAGTITALDQSITASDQSSGSSEQLTGLIQVSANVQPGDSGGPLVDGSGKVVGMTTAAGKTYTFRRHAGSTAGFAIPITAALPIGKQIAAGQASNTVHLGPSAQLGVEVSDSQTSSGAAVAGVLPGLPAEAAGIMTGDVITSFGGSPVDSATSLVTLIDRDHPGQSVPVGWMDQYGQSRTATVTLATGPAG